MAGVAGSNSFEGIYVYSSLVFVVCCVGSGLCDELITRSEEPYRLCVSKCVLYRNLKNEAS